MKPTYIDYINAFWTLNESRRLTKDETVLYFYLLSVANERRWPGEFAVSAAVICETTGLTRRGLFRARKGLAEAGLITYREGTSRADLPTYGLAVPAKAEKPRTSATDRCKNAPVKAENWCKNAPQYKIYKEEDIGGGNARARGKPSAAPTDPFEDFKKRLPPDFAIEHGALPEDVTLALSQIRQEWEAIGEPDTSARHLMNALLRKLPLIVAERRRRRHEDPGAREKRKQPPKKSPLDDTDFLKYFRQ